MRWPNKRQAIGNGDHKPCPSDATRRYREDQDHRNMARPMKSCNEPSRGEAEEDCVCGEERKKKPIMTPPSGPALFQVMRRTYISLSRKAGIDPKVIAEQ